MHWTLMIITWAPAALGVFPSSPTVAWVNNLPTEQVCMVARQNALDMSGRGLRVRATCTEFRSRGHRH